MCLCVCMRAREKQQHTTNDNNHRLLHGWDVWFSYGLRFKYSLLLLQHTYDIRHMNVLTDIFQHACANNVAARRRYHRNQHRQRRRHCHSYRSNAEKNAQWNPPHIYICTSISYSTPSFISCGGLRDRVDLQQQQQQHDKMLQLAVECTYANGLAWNWFLPTL